MRRILPLLLAVLIGAAGCNNTPSETSADSTTADSTGFLDKLKPEPKVIVPAGTRLHVALINGVSSNGSSAGDRFEASLIEPVIVNGKMVWTKGTKVRGRVVDVEQSGRVKGRASIQLTLTGISGENGETIDISTKPFTAVAEASKKRDAGIIAGGAGIGAAIGALAGGGKGAAVGAAVGGGAGTGTVLATKGKEIRYPAETRLNFTLASSVEL